MTATLQSLAASMSAAFVSKKRESGEEFFCLADGSPEWIADVVRAAHGEMLPNDWRYATIRDACSAIFEAEEDADEADIADGFCDGVDVYDSALLAWVSSSNYRTAYVDEAMEEYGPYKTLIEALTGGQMIERREVISSVLASLGNLVDAEA